MDFICFAVIRGAVLGISAVSATFLENFPAVLLGLGSCFGDFSGFSYFFGEFSSCFAVIRGAVLVISAVSATFFQNFSIFWAGLGCCFSGFMDYSYPSKTCQLSTYGYCTLC
jgi:hypothetical protein